MSVRSKSSTVDGELEEVFGAPVSKLYETLTGPDASPALTRVLELRSLLAAVEEQVARVRDRVHEAMAPDHDLGELSADKLRFDAHMLEAALDARDGYRAAIGELLRTVPPPDQQPRPVRPAQPRVAVVLSPSVAVPAPPRAGTARARRQ